jgi:hypothetical protein
MRITRLFHSLTTARAGVTALALSSCLAGCVTPKPLPDDLSPIALDHVPVLYDDKVRDSFAISDSQWQSIVALFDRAGDGESERKAIAQAIARFEQIAGEQTPIGNDGRKDYGSGAGRADCIDESINTTGFLRLLQERGVMRHHSTMDRVVRSFWCFDIVHWSAVVKDTDSGEYWAVDSWFNANGLPPVIQPLHDWYRKRVVYGYYASDAPTKADAPRP